MTSTQESISLQHAQTEAPASPRSVWIVPSLLIALSILGALASRGFFELDEIVHYLYSQRVWTDPSALLSIWGRLGCTGFFALGAPFGLQATRLMAVFVTLLVGLGTIRVLRYFIPPGAAQNSWFARHRIAWAWLLLFTQPCFTINSYTVMSEMLLACVWIWTVVALLANLHRPLRGLILAGFILGLGGLMRPEGWIAIACWPTFATLWFRLHSNTPQKFTRMLLAVAASTFLAGASSLAWFLLGVYQFQDWAWVIHGWPWAPASPYGRTGLMFLGATLISMAIWMWAPIITAIKQFLRPHGNLPVPSTRIDGLLLLVTPLVGLFLMHGFLGAFGLFGSLSLPRYFISIAPMASILALLGLISWEQRKPSAAPKLRRLALILALLPILILIAVGYVPAWKILVYRRLDVVIAEIRKRVPPGQYTDRIIAAHPYVLYELHMPLDSKGDLRRIRPDGGELATMPLGTIIVLDENLWKVESRQSPQMLQSWGYREDQQLTAKTDAMQPILPWITMSYERSRIRVWTKVK